jgi:hypothetical protein
MRREFKMTLKFTFAAIEAGDQDTEIYVNVFQKLSQDDFNEIEDAISSYIEDHVFLDFTQMIFDILSSFDYSFEILGVDHEFVI